MIVVNDGSTDATPALLAELQSDHPGLTVLTQPQNRGKAAALRTGFTAANEAGFTHAVTIDTDGQLDPEQIPQLLAVSRHTPHALVIGQRDETIEGYPSKNRLGRRVSNLMIRMQSGLRVADSQCGFRVYPLDFVTTTRCLAGRYGFETEIVTRAGWAGVPILQTPIRCRYFPRGQGVSHFRPWSDSWRGVGMHVLLVLRALGPLPKPRYPKETQPLARRILNWLNPLPAWRQLREDDVGRTNAAAGLALGAFIANLPAYGFQTILSLFFARRLHLHPVSVVIGSHLSTPPMGAVLVAGAIGVGHLVLHGSLPHLASYDVRVVGFSRLLRSSLLEWCVGSIPMGLFCAWVTYLVARKCLKLAAKPEAPDASYGATKFPETA